MRSSRSAATARSTRSRPASPAPSTALGVLPGGSTNVFARTLGLVERSGAGRAAGLGGPRRRSASSRSGSDSVNGRSFCFHTGVGYDAAVVREVERHASLKRWLGHPLFIYRRRADVGDAATTASARTSRSAASATDGGSGSRSPTATSRSCSTPTRTPTSATGRSTSRRRRRSTARSSPSRSGRCAPRRSCARSAERCAAAACKPSPHLDLRTDLAALTIRSDEPFPYQVDGDDLGDTRELRFTHVPDAVRLISRSGPEASTPRATTLTATSGTLVQIPSMPHSISSRIRSGSSHVHVLTSMPVGVALVDASSRSSARPRDAARRGPRCDEQLRPRRRAPRDVSHAVRIGDAAARVGDRAAAVDRLDPERRDQPPLGLAAGEQHRHRVVGDRVGRVEVGVARRVLDLDVDPHPGARVECVAERRDVCRQRQPPSRSTIDAPVGERRVVVDDERAVARAADVELDSRRRPSPGAAERCDRVLPFGAGCATVCQHCDGSRRRSSTHRCQRWVAGEKSSRHPGLVLVSAGNVS